MEAAKKEDVTSHRLEPPNLEPFELFTLPANLSKRIVDKCNFFTIANLEETAQVARNFILENVKDNWIEVEKANLFERKIFFYDEKGKLIHTFPKPQTEKKRPLIRKIITYKWAKFYIKTIIVQERLEWYVYTLLNFLWENSMRFGKLVLEDRCDTPTIKLRAVLNWADSLSMPLFYNKEYYGIESLKTMKYLRLSDTPDQLFLDMKCAQFEDENLQVSIETWRNFFKQWKSREREIKDYSVKAHFFIVKQLVKWLKLNAKFNERINLTVWDDDMKRKKKQMKWYLERQIDQKKLFVVIEETKVYLYEK